MATSGRRIVWGTDFEAPFERRATNSRSYGDSAPPENSSSRLSTVQILRTVKPIRLL